MSFEEAEVGCCRLGSGKGRVDAAEPRFVAADCGCLIRIWAAGTTITRVLSFWAHSIIAAETQLFLVQHGKALAAGEICAKPNRVGIEV